MSGRCVLAIETSTPRASLAVVKGEGVVFEETFESRRSHNSQLFAPLAAALEAAGDGLEAIVVGLGPGSYTGVRIGIAAGHGAALSRGVPLIGWSSLAAVEGVEEDDYHVIGDARRGRLYVAEVKDGDVVTAPELMSKEDAFARVRGGGLWVSVDDASPVPETGTIRVVRPSALALAMRAVSVTEEELALRASGPVEPLYLEGAFITVAGRKPGGGPGVAKGPVGAG